MPGKWSGSEANLKVSYRQAGGYTGLVLGAEVDARTLSSKDARKLRSLVESSRVLSATAAVTEHKAPSGVRDAANCEIEIVTDAGTTRVVYDDLMMPPELEGLCEFLRARAKPRPLR